MRAHPVVDLRSDTVTRPSPEMRSIIASAEVGDAVLGDDPTVAALESHAAEVLGKARALFFPSGIMANQAALLAQAPPGSEAVIDAEGHILNWEDGAAAAWGGIQLRPVPTWDGLLDPEAVAEAIRPESPYLPRTALVCLENTHNSAGGRVLPLERLHAVAAVCRERGVRLHLDGARLANAAVASGHSLAALAGPADTVMLTLSKGLGAPVGSLLAADTTTMDRAWRIRRRLGGGMRQAGLLAAAGLHALRNNVGRLVEDHRRASRLAEGASGIPGISASVPETNIVMITVEDPTITPEWLLGELEQSGIRLSRFDRRRLRAVTHLDVSDEGIERALEVLAAALHRRAPGA